jgi:uncharacterized protein (DUF1330 family)
VGEWQGKTAELEENEGRNRKRRRKVKEKGIGRAGKHHGDIIGYERLFWQGVMGEEMMKSSEVYYLVSVFVRPGQLETLRAYERAAASIMARHGGRFVRVFRPVVAGENGETPDEVHLLAFPSEAAFAGFRGDEGLRPYVGLREQAVERATFLKLVDVPLDDYFGFPFR